MLKRQSSLGASTTYPKIFAALHVLVMGSQNSHLKSILLEHVLPSTPYVTPSFGWVPLIPRGPSPDVSSVMQAVCMAPLNSPPRIHAANLHST